MLAKEIWVKVAAMRDSQNNMLTRQLALTAFYPDQHRSHIEATQRQGYRFSFLAEADRNQDTYHKLYDLVAEGVLSSSESDGHFEDFEAFCNNLLDRCYLGVADAHVLASYGQEWVGLASVVVDCTTLEGKSGLTMVKKAHQRRGVAKALKIISLTRAKEQGALWVNTENHPDNTPMLKLNRALGFALAPKGQP